MNPLDLTLDSFEFYVKIPVWVFTSIGIRNLALMRETQERFLTVPVQERYIQLAAEGEYNHLDLE